MPLSFRSVRASFLPCLFIASAAALAADQARKSPAPELSREESRGVMVAALEGFNGLVGGWRGVGQPVRGSNKGSWIETAEWVWELTKDRAGIRCRVRDGKVLSEGLLTWDPGAEVYRFDATLADGNRRDYAGRLEKQKLSLETKPDAAGAVHQLTITLLTEKRTLMLYQTRGAKQQQFVRVAEVGYTREGTKLAEEGAGGPECIVTGGKGTMSTVYKGKTYWFCCTGCRDAFLDDPDAILAEARERAAKKQNSSKP
ncbi:MAG: YHS domain-containing protein [Planctomycetaceae bacterium]